MSGPAPALDLEEPDGRAAAGVALVLHGGRSASQAPVRSRQLAVLRMQPFSRALRRLGERHGLVVGRLRYAVRGWNGPARSPLADAEWALHRLAGQYPGLPVALVGHSMGGRTALYVAGHGAVTTVVALAPWIEPGDPVTQLAGRRILIAHGQDDRMTSARRSAAYAEQATAAGASVTYVGVRNEAHAMLRRARLWHQLAAGFVVGSLFGPVAGAVDDAAARDALAAAEHGGRTLAV